MNKLYSLGLYEKALPPDLSWEEKLLAAGDAGFDFLEMSIDESAEKLARLDMGDSEIKKLIQIMERTGVSIETMCLSGHRKYPLGSSDPQMRLKAFEIMEKAISFAEKLGVRIIQLAGYDVFYEPSTRETKARFKMGLEIAVNMAAKSGILLGFETMDTEFMNTIEKAMDVVHNVDSPYLHIYPDLGNLTNAALEYGTSLDQDFNSGKGSILALHLKETAPKRYRDVPMGKGHVDFPAGINKAWSMGVRRFVTEFWYDEKTDWRESLGSARCMMSEILDRLSANPIP